MIIAEELQGQGIQIVPLNKMKSMKRTRIFFLFK